MSRDLPSGEEHRPCHNMRFELDQRIAAIEGERNSHAAQHAALWKWLREHAPEVFSKALIAHTLKSD